MRARAPAEVTLLSKVDDEDRIGIDRNTCQHIKRLEQTEQCRSSFGGKTLSISLGISLTKTGNSSQLPHRTRFVLFSSSTSVNNFKRQQTFFIPLSLFTLLLRFAPKNKNFSFTRLRKPLDHAQFSLFFGCNFVANFSR